jgi:hypothetical protein
MELQHFVARIRVAGPLAIDPAAVVDVFHQWVAAQSVPGVLLVDVAELLHVPDGPGVIAVGLEADLALDHSEGAWGALFRRKSMIPGSTTDRIRDALAHAAMIAVRLANSFPGRLKFSGTIVDLIVNDRALAPNAPATYAAALTEIEDALRQILGHGEFQLSRHDRDPRRRFGVTVTSGRPLALATLASLTGQTVTPSRG